jgi:hypothetical protein
MYQTGSGKIKSFFLDLITKYLVWLVIVIVIVIWWFFPDLIMALGRIVLFWGPAIVLIFTLILALTRTKFKTRRDEEHGITQYDITVNKWDFYLIDFIIYGGSLLILATPFVINDSGVGVSDLIQVAIFFIFANWLKNIFFNKILK